MKTDEKLAADWFLLGCERLKAADSLRKAEGITFSGVELLQEAVERYLKGYLIAQGWELKKIHNLFTLLDEAVIFESKFEAFDDLCENLTTQFWAQHYPGSDLTDVGKDYDELRRQAGDLIRLIEASVPPKPRS